VLIGDSRFLTPAHSETLILRQHWADISAESLDAGRPMGTADTWIAACARQWGIALVTGNYKDFEHISGMTLVPLGP
jgi:predicted nucleic acid-binding protein